MDADIGTNPPASAGAAGVQGGNPPGYEAGAGPSDADQGLAGQSDGDLPDGAEGEQAPELDEIELEGQKHQIPKALREYLDKGLDYTRKTQEHADTVRAREQEFAERQQLFEQREQASQHLKQGHAAVAALDLQLQQYQGINWAAASQQDPVAANAAYMQFMQLQNQRQDMVGKLQQAEQQFSEQSQQVAANRVQAVVSKWTPDEKQAVNAAAREYGITPPVLVGLFGNNPGLLNVLRDAAMFRQASRKADAAVAAAKPKPAQAQPAAQLPQGGRSTSPRSLNDPNLSDAEWTRMRNEQIRRSRRK
jgi:hypothetical protein